MNPDRNTFVDINSYIKYTSENFDHRFFFQIFFKFHHYKQLLAKMISDNLGIRIGDNPTFNNQQAVDGNFST